MHTPTENLKLDFSESTHFRNTISETHTAPHHACRMASSSFMLLSFFWTQDCSKELKVGLLKAFVLHTFTMYFLAWPAIMLSGSPGSTRVALAAAALVLRWPF